MVNISLSFMGHSLSYPYLFLVTVLPVVSHCSLLPSPFLDTPFHLFSSVPCPRSPVMVHSPSFTCHGSLPFLSCVTCSLLALSYRAPQPSPSPLKGHFPLPCVSYPGSLLSLPLLSWVIIYPFLSSWLSLSPVLLPVVGHCPLLSLFLHLSLLFSWVIALSQTLDPSVILIMILFSCLSTGWLSSTPLLGHYSLLPLRHCSVP